MTIITKNRGSYIQELPFDEERFKNFFDEIYEDTVEKEKITSEQKEALLADILSFIKSRKKVEATRLFDYIIRFSNERISTKTPYFTKFSASAFRRYLYKEASKNRGFDYHKGYGDYYTMVKMLVEQGLYHESLIKKYSEEEIRKIGEMIKPERDRLFDYSGLQILERTYLVTDQMTERRKIIELPQERFITAVTYLMQDEDPDKRLELIKQGYEAISQHYIGLATPTLKNAGTPHGTLSSCHIVTVDDDLQSIFNANTQVARFSKNGAGLGVFLGQLRATGSWIRGIKGNATGIIHPSRLNSVIAEYVNQGGNL